MDRFAAIADIHGNRYALEAVLEDIARRNVRTTVNLGDHLFGPLDPAGTADLLMPLHLPSVAGNQDHDPLNVDDAHREWLRTLPFSLGLPDILLFHGTPQADDVYLLETVHSGGVSLSTPGEVTQRLGEGDFPALLLCGHTHIPRVVAAGGRLIVNPGSVGLQAYTDDTPIPHVMETGSPHARYAILERQRGGWRVEHVQVVYDWEAAAQCATRNGSEAWAFRLRTGRSGVSARG